MAGFFSKKQYAAIVDSVFAMKLLNERCLKCPIRVMFFSSSSTVSIKALFQRRILSVILIREFFILFLTLVTNCMPLRKRFSNSACPIYSLSAHNFPFMFSRNRPCFNGSRSSTFPGVSMKFRISPLSLIVRCNLNPKNHPMELLPRSQVPQMSCRSIYVGYGRHAELWNQQNWCRYRYPAGLS